MFSKFFLQVLIIAKKICYEISMAKFFSEHDYESTIKLIPSK
jgi:hypothetical protein